MMRGGRDSASGILDYEPALVEAAVLHALRDHGEERDFRRDRDRLYEIRDPDAREAAFRDLHAAWFERLGLGRPIARAFSERSSIAAATRGCRIAAARSRRDEGAELFVRPPGPDPVERDRRWVVVRLRPEALGSADSLLLFLRHELLHIADMLDPCFGYEPIIRQPAADPAPDRLLRDRYRALWDASIDGRLVRLGVAPPSIRAGRLSDFTRVFPMLGPGTAEAFSRFFDGAPCTHADLAAFAADPGGALGAHAEAPHPGERCPLCRFPTYAFDADPSGLPGEVLDRIRENFPAWRPAQGLCQQCAELYRACSSALSGVGVRSDHAGEEGTRRERDPARRPRSRAAHPGGRSSTKGGRPWGTP